MKKFFTVRNAPCRFLLNTCEYYIKLFSFYLPFAETNPELKYEIVSYNGSKRS